MVLSKQSELYTGSDISPILIRQPSDNPYILLEQCNQIQPKAGRRMQTCRSPILDLTIRRTKRIHGSGGDQAENNVGTVALVKCRG
jgi:hypothetical protein